MKCLPGTLLATRKSALRNPDPIPLRYGGLLRKIFFYLIVSMELNAFPCDIVLFLFSLSQSMDLGAVTTFLQT